MLGEVSCEVLSGATEIAISEQPTLVQTTAPLGGQTVCIGTAIDPITFQFGGSATGIRLVNIPGGLTTATDAAAKTVTISGIPTGTGFVRVTTQGTTCQIQTLQHFVRVTTAPQIPDYILIDDAAGGTDPIPIINRQDGNIYNGQVYLCEQALASLQVLPSLQLAIMTVELHHLQNLTIGLSHHLMLEQYQELQVLLHGMMDLLVM